MGSETTRSMAELEKELEDANAALVEARKVDAAANSARCSAVNRVNRAQAAIERTLAEMRKLAPRDTDWARQQGRPVA